MRTLFAWLLAVPAVIGVFFGHPLALVVALAAAVSAALVVDRRSLAAVARIGVILTILVSSAMVGAVVAWSSDWSSGLDKGVATLLRLLVLVTLATLLARNVDAEALLRATRRFGMERLGLVLGLALNALPHLVDAVRHVVIAWRVRRQGPAGTAPSPMELLEVLLAHVARIADDAAAAAALRGHAALLQRPVLATAATPTIVATGAPGSGKSTAVLAVARRVQAAGQRVVGFVQPGRMEDGRKVAFAVRDLLTGDEAHLAELVVRAEGEHGTRFRFHEDGLAMAERALAAARSGDLLVVDELGPIELRGEGHMGAVQRALQVQGLKAVILVVRAQLVPALLAALEVDDAEVIQVAAAGGEKALEEAVARRCGPASQRTPGYGTRIV